MIREAMPTFLDKDLVMEVLTGCHGLSGDTVYPQIFYPKLIGSRFRGCNRLRKRAKRMPNPDKPELTIDD